MQGVQGQSVSRLNCYAMSSLPLLGEKGRKIMLQILLFFPFFNFGFLLSPYRPATFKSDCMLGLLTGSLNK